MPSTRRRSPVPPLVVLCYAVDASLGIAHLANLPALEARSFLGGLAWFVHLDNEAGFATWYSSVQLLAIAASLALLARAPEGRWRRGSRILWPYALAFLVFSIDEVAQMHERLGDLSDALLTGGSREHTAFHHTGIWMFVLGIPVCAYLLFMLRGIRGCFPARGDFARHVVGCLLLMGGALGVEAASNWIDPSTSAGVILVLVEEVGEMVGATTILWGCMGSLDFSRFASRELARPPRTV